jgi:hypothetical protein
MTLRAVVTLLATVVACSNGGEGDRRTDCVELREHAAELTAARAGGDLGEEERAEHERALIDSAGEAFVRQCVEDWGQKEVACGLAAATVEEMRRCRARR